MNGTKLTVEQYENKLRTDINTRRLSEETIQSEIAEYKEKLKVEKEATELAAAEQEANQGGIIEEEFVPPGHEIDPEARVTMTTKDMEKFGLTGKHTTGSGVRSVLETDLVEALIPEAEKFITKFKSTEFEDNLNIEDIHQHAGDILFKTESPSNFAGATQSLSDFAGGGGMGGQLARQLYYPSTTGGFASAGSGITGGQSNIQSLLNQLGR